MSTSPAWTGCAEPSSDIWDRIRKGFAMPDLEGTLVDDRTQWYAARPDYMERMVGGRAATSTTSSRS
jgi:hypothetical protein